jgi:Fic family protein
MRALWYFETDLPELKNRPFSIHPREEARKTTQSSTEKDFDKVSKTIGVTKKEISRAFAAVFHHRFVQTHPFSEGNGRIARLLMNALLLKDGYHFIAIIPNIDRQEYLKTLAEADSGNTSSFVNFIARCVERALDMYLNTLEEPEILTLAEASKITEYSQEYLSLLARKGLLGAFKQGRNWFVPKPELKRYLASVRRLGKEAKS